MREILCCNHGAWQPGLERGFCKPWRILSPFISSRCGLRSLMPCSLHMRTEIRPGGLESSSGGQRLLGCSSSKGFDLPTALLIRAQGKKVRPGVLLRETWIISRFMPCSSSVSAVARGAGDSSSIFSLMQEQLFPHHWFSLPCTYTRNPPH